MGWREKCEVQVILFPPAAIHLPVKRLLLVAVQRHAAPRMSPLLLQELHNAGVHLVGLGQHCGSSL